MPHPAGRRRCRVPSPQPQENRTINPGRRNFRAPDRYYGPRINDRIRISPIRLIDENQQMVGVIETHVALQRARELGLDLVEISPETSPPVCKIVDFGKFKYEQNKKDKATRSKTKHADLKEVRLGRSMKIDPHDIEIRVQQARRFLMEGHKVLIVQNFVGREMMHKERGYQRINEITQKLADIAKVEVPPRMAGRRMSTIYAPDRMKIDQIKRREASRKPADGLKDEPHEQRSAATRPVKPGTPDGAQVGVESAVADAAAAAR